MQNLAPIVLFVYNRPEHSLETLQSLQKNKLADQSILYIISDGPKEDADAKGVESVRTICRQVEGFKKVELIEKPHNDGLAKSIVEGISKLFEKHEKLIVMEDDLVSSPFFLSFMNQALDRFRKDKEVWHISGWNYPIEKEGLQEAFFWRAMNCWGWGSWRDRWQHFEKDPESLIDRFTKTDIDQFSCGGAFDFWEQVKLNASGQMNTWAIFWYATIFRNNGLCLNPTTSYIHNIGLDGSGEHGDDQGQLYAQELSRIESPRLDIPIEENQKAVERIKSYVRSLKPSLLKRALLKLNQLVKGKR